MTWQPIETAPKDGSEVIYWSETYGCRIGNEPPGCRAGYWVMANERWVGSSDMSFSENTHWMPLPTPPEDA